MPLPNPLRWLLDEPRSALHRLVRFQLVCELLLLVVWVTLYGVLEGYALAASPDLWYARFSLVFSLVGHLGTPLALIKLDHGMGKGHVGWERWFWLFGNLFTDIWSALDAWLHLPDKALVAEAIAICRAFTTVALVTSSLAVIVYAVVLFTRAEGETTTTTVIQMTMHEPLLRNTAKVRPLYKGML